MWNEQGSLRLALFPASYAPLAAFAARYAAAFRAFRRRPSPPTPPAASAAGERARSARQGEARRALHGRGRRHPREGPAVRPQARRRRRRPSTSTTSARTASTAPTARPPPSRCEHGGASSSASMKTPQLDFEVWTARPEPARSASPGVDVEIVSHAAGRRRQERRGPLRRHARRSTCGAHLAGALRPRRRSRVGPAGA